MKTIISNRLLRIAEHPEAFVTIMYVKVAIQTQPKIFSD